MKNDEQVKTYIRRNRNGTFRADYRIVGPCTAPGKGRLIAHIVFTVNEDHTVTVGPIRSEKYQSFIKSALETINAINSVPLGAERLSMTMYIFRNIGAVINAAETNLAEKTSPIVEDPNNVLKED